MKAEREQKEAEREQKKAEESRSEQKRSKRKQRESREILADKQSSSSCQVSDHMGFS